ncbi:RNA-dependent RNA polymerase [Diaporthe helianthi]|uniref:RNA-dependent RNA polymerase n=1 Tax=Diaporthe helianthi TaxID=158607 RepID=A0A2P5ICF0_DIAHE|nr:RNA-dependent RNA polymerase [Diaporthe helianthi]
MSPPDRSPASWDRDPLAQYSTSTLPSTIHTASIPHQNGGTPRFSPSRVPPATGRTDGPSYPNIQSNMRRLPPPSGSRNTPHGNPPRPSTSPLAPYPGRSAQSNSASADMRTQQHRQRQQRVTTAILTGTALSSAQKLILDLFELPKDIKLQEIWESLTASHLSLTRVEMYEDEDGARTGKVRVHIEPPPTKWPTWTGPVDCLPIARADSSKLSVRFQAVPFSPAWLETPCGKRIPERFCQQKFSSNKLVFGMMASESTMWNLPQFSYESVTLVTNFPRRRFEIGFKTNLGRHGVKVFKIQVDFNHPRKIIWEVRENGAWGLAMLLPSPPKLYFRIPVSHDDQQSLWQEWDVWARQTHISGELHKLKDLPAGLEKPTGQSVDFGRWTTYHFDFDSCTNEWESVRTYLADYNVKIVQVDRFALVNPGASNAWRLLDSAEMTLELLGCTDTYHLDFPARYQLEVCISHGLLNEYSIGAQFLGKLTSFDADRARLMLEGVAEANKPLFEPMKIFDDPKVLHYWPNARVPPYATLVRRAVITPTAIYFKTPSVELTNRILRKYSDLNDRFLRVQFTDEVTFGKIFSSQDTTKDDNLLTRVYRVMRNGIIIGDRHYRFLAFSNSQFRENGAFFFCDTDHTTCESIREWMGDFRHIRSVGKFAARMGQCFTTTRQVNGINIPKIRLIGDIEQQTGDSIWNFTDGVGKISPFLATLIANERDLPETPSCFQIRMGGVKGTLVPWPDVPPNEVHVRPSQEKFKAVYNGLEIIKTSAFSHATLNKQVIPVLTALGVEKRVFVGMLESELRAYKEALADPMKAGGLLRSQVDENQITLTMAEMVDTFMDSKEPFLWTLLRLWKCWVLRRLKEKFAVSVKNSAMVFGIVDEIGVLRGHSRANEGRTDHNVKSLPQIFLQIPIEGSDGRSTTNYEVITGLCVVGRNPSLHPGDVRVVEAVDAPELGHLKNVVVFPKTGDRDIPSMCSGGDMDGDDYFVYWDERLIPPEWHHPPLDHDADSSSPGLDKAEDVTIDEVAKFFVQYMKNDSLGRIANAHIAQADSLAGGVKHPICKQVAVSSFSAGRLTIRIGIELAKLHSKAVDYIKSGEPAVMQRRLQPQKWPHWMEREKKSYRSHSALGQMYDRIKTEEFHAAHEMSFDVRILWRYQLDGATLAKAGEIKVAYDIAMRRLMGQHEAPVTEFEIWSTFILSKPRVGSDYKLQENVGREMAALKDRFRAECKTAVAGNTQTLDPTFPSSMVNLEKLDRFVAAMYTVTHNEVRAAARERLMVKSNNDGGPEEVQMPLISFPWLFHRELARVALGRGGEVVPLKERSGEVALDDGEFGVVGDTVSANAVGMEEVTQPAQRESGGNATERGHGADDCVRTSGGQVVHRGQILTLFTEPGEQSNAQQDTAAQILPTARSISDNSMVPDDSTGSSAPASPRTAHRSEDEDEYVGFEEVGDDDQEDEEEDALEVLTRKIGM